jgi:mono/diheme cytochrome c family protein
MPLAVRSVCSHMIKKRPLSQALVGAASLWSLFVAPVADGRVHSSPVFSPTAQFAEESGEEIYVNVCQGCHMPDGRGAAGAGVYPSLAGDAKLASPSYAVFVVVNGLNGMPSFGAMMNDKQVAAVVDFLRTHFANDYPERVTDEDVKFARQAPK